MTVEATWKDKLEAKGTRMRELAELEVGDVIELDLKTTNMQRAEAAVGRFNKNNKGRRLTYSIYAAVMKIWRVE
jgi:flagellar motor switch protein FliM